jgi:YVTN family beta-propeller protein
MRIVRATSASDRRVAGGVVVLLVVGLLSACSSGSDRSADPGATSTPEAPAATGAREPKADPAYIVERLKVGKRPCGILGAAGKIWVSLYGENKLVAIDPDTGEIGKPTSVGASPCGLAFGAGSIWVENYGENDVTRVDADSGKVQATIAVGGAPYDVTFAAGSAWVTNYVDGSVTRIDAASGKATTIKVGGSPTGIAPTPGAVWVAVGAPGLVKIDAHTGTVVDRVDVAGLAGWTAYHGDTVWVGVGSTEVEVDGSTGEIARRVDVGRKPLDGDVLDGVVWVPDGAGDLYPIEASTGKPLGHLASGTGNPFVISGYDGKVWAVDFAGEDVVAIDPHRALR